MILQNFAYETAIRTPGGDYDRRSGIQVFLVISEPMYSFGRFSRDSSFVAEAASFPEEGDCYDDDEMKIYCRGMLSLIEDDQTVFLRMEDFTRSESGQYQSDFFERIWHYLENCARSFFPDAREFCVLTEENPENSNWESFCLRLGYGPDGSGKHLRKSASPAEVIALPAPHLIEKDVLPEEVGCSW